MHDNSKPAINFFSESTNFILKDKTILRKWIMLTIGIEKSTPGLISFIFCSDNYLLKLNKSYLKHDYLTDIITFDYSDNEGVVSGDIFISIDRVKENAVIFKRTFKNELYRVMIHGVLHIMGYKDKNQKQKNLMTSKEDYYLSLLAK